jgi:hypothetical protein
MKKTSLLILAAFSAFLVISNCCLALHLADPNGAELTVDPNAAPQTSYSGFHIDGQITAWIDHRDEVDYIPGIYMTYFDDPSYTEYLVDPNAFDAEIVKVAGSNLFYNIRDPELGKVIIRMADCTNPAAPVIQDIDVPILGEGSVGGYLMSLDADNNLLVYATYDYSSYGYHLYAVDLNDPSYPSYLIAEYVDNSYLYSNLALDGTTCTWSYEDYDSEMGMYYNLLAVADISDPNNPVIQTTILPGTEKNGMSIWNVDISGDWLAALGYYNGNNSLFCIFHFKNPDNTQWSVVEFYNNRMDTNVEMTPPAIDLPYVVWSVNSYGIFPSASAVPAASSQSQASSSATSAATIIAGATLLDNGKAVVNILKAFENPSLFVRVYGVQISGSNIVWSEDKEWYEDDTYYHTTDLYGGTLVSDCGDWGYSFADLNHDCQVNLSDFVIFAGKWLDCTMPETPDCIYGDVYGMPDGTWRTME